MIATCCFVFSDVNMKVSIPASGPENIDVLPNPKGKHQSWAFFLLPSLFFCHLSFHFSPSSEDQRPYL